MASPNVNAHRSLGQMLTGLPGQALTVVGSIFLYILGAIGAVPENSALWRYRWTISTVLLLLPFVLVLWPVISIIRRWRSQATPSNGWVGRSLVVLVVWLIVSVLLLYFALARFNPGIDRLEEFQWEVLDQLPPHTCLTPKGAMQNTTQSILITDFSSDATDNLLEDQLLSQLTAQAPANWKICRVTQYVTIEQSAQDLLKTAAADGVIWGFKANNVASVYLSAKPGSQQNFGALPLVSIDATNDHLTIQDESERVSLAAKVAVARVYYAHQNWQEFTILLSNIFTEEPTELSGDPSRIQAFRPVFASAYFLRGLYTEEVSHLDADAKKAFTRALSYAPTFSEAWIFRANLYKGTNSVESLDESIKDNEQVLTIGSSTYTELKTALTNLTYKYWGEKKSRSEALTYVDDLMKLDIVAGYSLRADLELFLANEPPYQASDFSAAVDDYTKANTEYMLAHFNDNPILTYHAALAMLLMECTSLPICPTGAVGAYETVITGLEKRKDCTQQSMTNMSNDVRNLSFNLPPGPGLLTTLSDLKPKCV